MPAATLSELGLENATPADLETMRAALVLEMNTKYKGYEDPAIPDEMLNRLAVIISSLRRKNAGPPKPKSTKSKGPVQTTNDFVV